MALNKYGIETGQWKMLPVEDQNAIIRDYDASVGRAPTQPAVGGYAEGAVTNPEQTRQMEAASTATANPSWVFAVNMPSTYPDFAAMKATGAGLVVVADDPNAQLLIDGARAWGVTVAVQVNAPDGISPEAYAARVAEANTRWHPDRLVLDIEGPGKGYAPDNPNYNPNYQGWDWSAKAAPLIAQAALGTPTAVTMGGGGEDDYNYGAYQTALPTPEFWVQAYDGNMNPTPGGADQAVANLVRNGVDSASVVPIIGPGQPTGTRGLYASYGIPTGTATAGVYGTPADQAAAIKARDTAIAAAANPGQYIPGTPSTYTTAAAAAAAGTGGAPGSTTSADWAGAYFGNLGLPPEVQTQVNSLFSKYPDDPQLAIALARQYIHTTPWFQQTFPGYFEGIRTGLFTDETGYRGYVNQANVYTMQYFNRPITSMEIESALHQGFTPEIIGRTYEAGAIAKAQGPDIQYELGAFGEGQQTPDQLGQAVTDESRQQAGLSSVSGARIDAAIDRAKKRMASIFQGQLAIPNTAGQALAPQKPDLPA